MLAFIVRRKYYYGAGILNNKRVGRSPHYDCFGRDNTSAILLLRLLLSKLLFRNHTAEALRFNVAHMNEKHANMKNVTQEIHGFSYLLQPVTLQGHNVQAKGRPESLGVKADLSGQPL